LYHTIIIGSSLIVPNLFLPKEKGAQQSKRGDSEKDGSILFMRVKVDQWIIDYQKRMKKHEWMPDMWDHIIYSQ
jgi:hypothetical protein